ncbi:hypothetical protein MKX08_004754 [Trichoderma sp. CBMAI-0020]|nr:hypothetical protein MKX08_004754 [Trichoderma sp. CBMAI-0020]
MGTKREYDEVESQGADSSHGASEKRHKSYIGRKRLAQEDSGAKKRIRAIERSLRRNQDMPVNVRIDLERELASQKQIVADQEYKRKRSTMISKYHMVRFFERKKASRLVKQLKRKLEQESDSSEADKLRHDLHVAEVDEAYTLYFPHLETYVGLYSSAAKKTDEEETEEGKVAAAKAALEAERPPMWSVIEKALADGTRALEKLRDRRSPDDNGEVDDRQPPIRPPSNTPAPRHNNAPRASNNASRKNQEQPKRSAKAPEPAPSYGDKEQHPELNRRERRKLMRESLAAATNDEDDENGDGGFFEGL